MNLKLHPITFSLTLDQIKWLEMQHERTGLKKAEIIRRALDEYVEAEETKEQRRLFSPEQRKDIREVARRRAVGEIEVVRDAVNRELKFYKKLHSKGKGGKK